MEGKKGTHQQFLTSVTTTLYYHLSSKHLLSDRYVLRLEWRRVNSQTPELAVTNNHDLRRQRRALRGLKHRGFEAQFCVVTSR